MEGATRWDSMGVRIWQTAVVGLVVLTLGAADAWAMARGEPQRPGAYPGFASIGVEGDRFLDPPLCSGALIAPDRVLTAGHCADILTPRGTVVWVGHRGTSAGRRERRVRAIRVHPRFRIIQSDITPDIEDSTAAWDVGILVLERPVRGVAPLRPATPALAARLQRPGAYLRALGRGGIDADLNPSRHLRMGRFTLQRDRDCTRVFGRRFHRPSTLCANSPPAGPSVCGGDSGGPVLASDGHGRQWVVGVISWGRETMAHPCGQGTEPQGLAAVAPVYGFVTRGLSGFTGSGP